MTTPETRYTEREVRLREREAFVMGVRIAEESSRFLDAVAEARRRYPPPTVTRPREVLDTIGQYWRCVDGRVEYRHRVDSGWLELTVIGSVFYNHCRSAIADVLANPTETVEDDA